MVIGDWLAQSAALRFISVGFNIAKLHSATHQCRAQYRRVSLCASRRVLLGDWRTVESPENVFFGTWPRSSKSKLRLLWQNIQERLRVHLQGRLGLLGLFRRFAMRAQRNWCWTYFERRKMVRRFRRSRSTARMGVHPRVANRSRLRNAAGRPEFIASRFLENAGTKGHTRTGEEKPQVRRVFRHRRFRHRERPCGAFLSIGRRS
jgi:hypothetical protein